MLSPQPSPIAMHNSQQLTHISQYCSTSSAVTCPSSMGMGSDTYFGNICGSFKLGATVIGSIKGGAVAFQIFCPFSTKMGSGTKSGILCGSFNFGATVIGSASSGAVAIETFCSFSPEIGSGIKLGIFCGSFIFWSTRSGAVAIEIKKYSFIHVPFVFYVYANKMIFSFSFSNEPHFF